MYIIVVTGSATATPELTNSTGVSGPCPPGSYCLQQTSSPTPCPRGTYSNTTKLEAETECSDCPYGLYCGELGLTEPSGPCEAGFYCLLGAQSPNNAAEDSTGIRSISLHKIRQLYSLIHVISCMLQPVELASFMFLQFMAF